MRSALDILTAIRAGQKEDNNLKWCDLASKTENSSGRFPLSLPENTDTHLPVPFSSGQ
jgi:hypothetical protein